MANDHDHHADGIAKPTHPGTEGRALATARDPRPATSGTAMLTKSEIALLAVAVLGTLAAWLTQAHPSPARQIEDQPGLACNVPAGAARLVGPLTRHGHLT
jgi:hypothetical protein